MDPSSDGRKTSTIISDTPPCVLTFRAVAKARGERGWVLPLRQVADAISALNYMAGRPEVDPARICLSGTSFGASVSVYTAGLDSRVAAVIGQGGWASGEQMFRAIHSTPEKWAKFSELLMRGRARKPSDPPIMAHRYDLIVIPERLRANVDGRSIMQFPVEMALETLSFNPGDLAARVAPRPLLLIHSAQDEVITADGSMELFKSAGYHGDLHIMGGVDHFMFGEDDNRVAGNHDQLVGALLPCHLEQGVARTVDCSTDTANVAPYVKMTKILEISGLTAGYGYSPVLTDIDISIAAGEFVAVIGANGAGKTTLLRTISGLLKPMRGEIRHGGARIDSLSAPDVARLGLLHVPENRHVFPDQTTEDNLALGCVPAHSKEGRARNCRRN